MPSQRKSPSAAPAADGLAETVAEQGASLARLGKLRPDLDLTALRAEFTAQAAWDADAFVVWLKERDVLTTADLTAWHADTELDLDPAATAAMAGVIEADIDPVEERYEVLAPIGRGAMGSVHVARDVALRRKVAIKRIDHKARRQLALRFLKEVQITAQLEHPYIVPVYGLEHRDDGEPTFAMKLICGQTLSKLIAETKADYDREGPLDNDHSLEVRLEHFLKVCDAVDYAHAKGVVHRDLKPDNIMLGPHREVYVMDWGIARLMDGDADDEEGIDLDPQATDASQRTSMGVAVGTPSYMSPEQAAARRDLDGTSDQFSLGLVLWELVTLRRANDATTFQQAINNARTADFGPLRHHDPSHRIPEDLAAIIHKATSLRKRDRYPSVGALADDLRSYLRGLETVARPDNGWRRLRRWMGRHRRWVFGTIVPLALVLPAITAIVLTSLRAHRTGRETVEALSAQLLDEIAGRVGLQLERYLGDPARVNGENRAAVRLGQLDPKDLRAWEPHLIAQIKRYEGIAYIGYGARDKRYVGMERGADGRLLIEFRDEQTGGDLIGHYLDDAGKPRGKPRISKGYDPTARPWYQVAAAARKGRWSKPYVWFQTPTVGVTMAHPHLTRGGDLLGVFAADKTLGQIDGFLRGLSVGRTGRVFVIERTGEVIASSAAPEAKPDAKGRRFHAGELDDDLIREAAEHLRERYGDLKGVERDRFDFTRPGGGRCFVRVSPFRDKFGLDWLIVVAIPESDFMDSIEEGTRSNVVLGLVALGLAMLLGLGLAVRVRERNPGRA